MKRSNLLVITFSLLLLMLGIAQMAAADAKPTRVIRLIERAQAVSFQDSGPPGPSLGDRLIFTSNLFDEEGKLVGRDGTDCVTVRIDPSAPVEKQQIVQCVITAELFSEGQLTFQ